MSRRILLGCLAPAGVLVALGLLAYLPESPVNDLLRRYEGYSLFAVNSRQTVRASKPGDIANATFRLRNVSDATVTVYGMQSGCGCIRSESIPWRVEAGGSKDFQFDIHSQGHPAGTTAIYEVRLFIDAPSPPVVLTIELCVDPPPAAPPDAYSAVGRDRASL